MSEPRLRRAAAIVLARGEPLEVYLVRRSESQRFFPGYWAFPGGTLDKEENDFGLAALRELVEETGVFVTDAPLQDGFDRTVARRALLANDALAFAHALASMHRRLAPERLTPVAHLVTPEFAPTRYDTRFFAVRLPDGEAASIDVGELVDGAWWRPDEALVAWDQNALLLAPPTLAILRALAAHGLEAGARRLTAEDDKPHHERFRVEVHPGVTVLPLRTPTLPPATTTNLVAFGRDRVVLVDPGPATAAEHRILESYLDRHVAEGARIESIVLTHHHHDHVDAAELVRSRYGAPILAHAETARRLAFKVDRTLGDGDAIELGRDAHTGKAWTLRVLHTPGHTKGSLSLVDGRWGAMAVGDLVSSVSTIVVDPDDGGDMGAYMRSLARAATLEPAIVIPGHGPAVAGAKLLADTLAHRRWRESLVLDSLAAGEGTLDVLLPRVYADVAPAVLPIAERSLAAHLAKLEGEGKARESRGVWSRS